MPTTLTFSQSCEALMGRLIFKVTLPSFISDKRKSGDGSGSSSSAKKAKAGDGDDEDDDDEDESAKIVEDDLGALDSTNIIARAPRRSALASGLVAAKSSSSSSASKSSSASSGTKPPVDNDEEAEF